tara:strand:- start:316 stop:570 length:255 start_codon:yes stop_codon:yes gene_type:complete
LPNQVFQDVGINALNVVVKHLMGQKYLLGIGIGFRISEDLHQDSMRFTGREVEPMLHHWRQGMDQKMVVWGNRERGMILTGRIE